MINFQSALYGPHDGARYIPLLAKEGVKHKLGGEDGRGGLLVVNKDGDITLHFLGRALKSKDNSKRALYDKACVDVM